ncbi:MAG: hypothetical protein DSY87_07880 [Methylococcus sp.]|nr:MAG: hypothetical protein DSY87_07880 [Methylococcus sp.]
MPLCRNEYSETYLRPDGENIGRKHVAILMKKMGVEAIARYGAPEAFNTDQGSQFTNGVFTCKFKEHDMRISMDGKGI